MGRSLIPARTSKPRPARRQRAEIAVRIQAVRPQWSLGEQRVSVHRRTRDDLAFIMAFVVEDERSWTGQLHDEHRFHRARISVHGRVAVVWVGKLE